MELKELRDIVKVVQRNEYISHPPLNFRKLSVEDSKFGELYEILINRDIKSDSEAIFKLYGEANSGNNYKSLKSYFLSRVLNNITFLDLSKSEKSEYAKALFKAYKYLFFLRVLLMFGSRTGAISLARKVLKIAKKYEIHSVVIEILTELRTNASQLGNQSDFSKYSGELSRETEILLNESTILNFEEEITIHFSKSLFVPETLRTKAGIALNSAEKLLTNCDSYYARVSIYRLQYIFHQLNGEPIRSASVCDEAIAYMESNIHMTPPSRLAQFGLYKLENFILARNYAKGKKAALYCKQHITQGMNLWFNFKQYEFLLMMQTMNFEEAYQIYKEVIGHERFNAQSNILQEKWRIFGFNIDYVVRSNSQKKSYMTRRKDFKKRFIDFPTYQKDKQGFNVAILVLNILVALEENKLDLLLEQEEALSSYRFKYLNEKHCHQSFILFKLIRLVTKNDFDLSKIEKKSAAFENELVAHKLAPGEIFESIQVIPPQWVWSRIKAILASPR
jgi:hypothetical protein